MSYTIILQALISLLVVIVLACLVLFLLRKINYNFPLRKKKLWQVQEIYYLDSSNKIIEVRKENHIYTLLVGRNNNIMLDKNDNTEQAN